MQKLTPQEVEKALQKLIHENELHLEISVEQIKDWVFNSPKGAKISSQYFAERIRELMDLIQPVDIEEANVMVQIMQNAWNVFPHKSLDGKAPQEVWEQKMSPKNDFPQIFTPKRNKITTLPDFKEYLETIESDVKTYTQILKKFEKQFGTYPRLKMEEAENVFLFCENIYFYSKNEISKYNALRLAKYTLQTDSFLKKYYKQVWNLYRQTVFEDNGNLRNAGVQLLSRYYFGIDSILRPWRKAAKFLGKEEMERFFVNNLVELETLEIDFFEKHNLKGDCLFDRRNYVPWASETKNVFLKTIRRGIEEFRCLPIMHEMARKYNLHIRRSEG